MIEGILKLRASTKQSTLRGEYAINDFINKSKIPFLGPKSVKKGRDWHILSKEGLIQILQHFSAFPLDPRKQGTLSIFVCLVTSKNQKKNEIVMQTEILKGSSIPLCSAPESFSYTGSALYYSQNGHGWYLRKDEHINPKPKLIYKVK